MNYRETSNPYKPPRIEILSNLFSALALSDILKFSFQKGIFFILYCVTFGAVEEIMQNLV